MLLLIIATAASAGVVSVEFTRPSGHIDFGLSTGTASVTATAKVTGTTNPPTPTPTETPAGTPTGLAYPLAGQWQANWNNSVCFLDGQPFASIGDTTYTVTASNDRLDIVAADGQVIGRGLLVAANGNVDPAPFVIPTGQCQISGRTVQFEFDYLFNFQLNGTGSGSATWSYGKDSFCAVCSPVFDQATLIRIAGPPTATPSAIATPTPSATQTPSDTPVRSHATLAEVQRTVFSPSCAIVFCHGATFPAGNLTLTEGTSYAQLVGVQPENASARQLGFLRVAPFDPENSFLVVKLEGPPSFEFGAQMPLGGLPLSPEQIQLIRDWIALGANDDPEFTPSASPTDSPTPNVPTSTQTSSPMATATEVISPTPSLTKTLSASVTPTGTPSATLTSTLTPSPSHTRTSTSTSTTTPSPTLTPSFTRSPSRTRTSTRTRTPTPKVVNFQVSSSYGAPGERIPIWVSLVTAGLSVTATVNDLSFDPELVSIEPSACRIERRLGQSKSLIANVVSADEFETVVRFSLVSNNRDPILDGRIFTCEVSILPTSVPGTYPIYIDGARAFGPSGSEITDVDRLDGSLTVSLVPRPCAGDCDGSDTVDIPELIRSVRISLGAAFVDECQPIDRNLDGAASIDELILAVSSSVKGCRR